MKEISCKDVSGLDCEFKASGETAEEVKGKLMEHAKAEHADAMAAMTDEQKAAMSAKIDTSFAA